MPKPRFSNTPSRRRRPSKERRAPRGQGGLLRWVKSLKGLLSRPLALQRRNGRWQLRLVDRRRAAAALTPETHALCDDLRERLLAHPDEVAVHALRHLVRVHDTLTREGWPGVEALPGRTLRKSLAQTQMLLKEHRSEPLLMLQERLRVMQVAADLREERGAKVVTPRPAGPVLAPDSEVEVSEVSVEEYDASERSWVGTVPQQLPTSKP